MIDEPFDAPAVNATDTVLFPGVTDVTVGAAGTARGVTDTDVEATPSPIEFTAFNLMVYSVPLDRPLIEIGEVVAAGERVVQFVPLSVEYL